MSHTRRHFLKFGAAAAAGAALLKAEKAHAGTGMGSDPGPDDVVKKDAHAFFLGVASADVTHDSALVWSRYDGDRNLRLVVWAEDDKPTAKGGFRAVVHHDLPKGMRGAFEIPVDKLAPSTEYRFAFYALDGDKPVSRSHIGRFKTAPPDDALVPVTLGATCCTMNGMDQAVLEAAGARRDIDVLCKLGDAVYADGAHSLAEYRKSWWENLSKPGYQALRASTSMLATWDDHEVDNDWDPASVSPEKLYAARTAFFEHMPMRRPQAKPEQIWRKTRWGKTLEVFVLDCRGERDRSCSPKQYISAEQMEWLKSGLKNSDAVFKVIVNSVPITRFPPIFHASIKDRWETFPEQRIELLSFIETEQVPGVIFVSGDFHLAMIARASPSGPGRHTMEVLAGPGAQVPHALVPWLFGKQFDWASGRNNVTTLHFDPNHGGRVDVKYQGDDGTIFHHAAYKRRLTGGFDKLEDWRV